MFFNLPVNLQKELKKEWKSKGNKKEDLHFC